MSMSSWAQQASCQKCFPCPRPRSQYYSSWSPTHFKHSDRSKAYDFIVNKFKANKLNHAGRLTYINSDLASVPIYYMSTVLFSKTFIAKITSIIRKFWWAGVQDENSTTSFHFRSWEDICQSKDNGGLGIRDLLAVNLSLILHAAWNIATDKDPFLTAILKSKYYPNTSFWLSSNSNTKSIFWGSILQMKQIQANQCTIRFTRVIQVFGPHLGVLSGTPSMIISTFLSLYPPSLKL